MWWIIGGIVWCLVCLGVALIFGRMASGKDESITRPCFIEFHFTTNPSVMECDNCADTPVDKEWETCEVGKRDHLYQQWLKENGGK